MTKRITMRELARLAGVDISTVSRSLNDSPLVAPETKAAVLRIAAEKGYVVNATARNLRRQSSETIGIVIPVRSDSGQTISDPFYLTMVGAVSNAASKRGYDLMVNLPHDEDPLPERRLVQTGRADGLIVIGQAGRLGQLNALGPLLDRVVVWGGKVGRPRYTLVGSDNLEGGRLAGAHLVSRGRRRFVFLGDHQLPEVALRLQGLREAMEAKGLNEEPRLIRRVDFGGDAAYRAVIELIDTRVSFDAIFAASDVLAMHAIHALHARKLRVPEDVAVVGYDNIAQAEMTTPPLTTVDQHIQLGGETMVDLLLRKIAGEKVKSVVTPTTLVVRASS